MARLARAEVFRADEVAIVHVVNRVVRRCFLLGDDPVTGKNYDHRKQWIDDRLMLQAKYFGIDLLCQAIMSNHIHLVLRSRPDVVAEWDDAEVARRWLMLCPAERDQNRQPVPPTEFELNRLTNDKDKLAKIRLRLSDISWWMRLLSQEIAQRANAEDEEVGKFWQARFRGVRLLDETALLACAAYVDLNPIRAAMAETIEESDYTSAQKRVSGDGVRVSGGAGSADPPESFVPHDQPSQREDEVGVKRDSTGLNRSARHLAPVDLKEGSGKTGPEVHKAGSRCSNKGFLPMSTAAYLELLDWTGRQVVPGKSGATPKHVAPLMERLGLNEETWCSLVRDFGKLFSVVAGQPAEIDRHQAAEGGNGHRFRARADARKLLAG